ncbi:MAG: class I SAM-dependent methyltransferase [Usitatibacteraceae bacterium]
MSAACTIKTRRHMELVKDEVDFLQSVVPLAGADAIELGCGKAELARKLVERGLVKHLTAYEVDQTQHDLNLASPKLAGLDFAFGGADDIALPDASCDLVLMLKSLHHVPMERLDRALQEIRRVLKPGGYLYVSEPVFAGPFNDIVRIFHDEGVVRAAAHAALTRAVSSGLMIDAGEIEFDMPLAFANFDDFFNKIVRVTHSEMVLVGDKLQDVKSRFEKHMTPEGARFVRPMRVNVLRAPG